MKAKDLGGLSIYHDQKNRTIYYSRFLKKAYIIDDSDVGKYTFYSYRFIGAILLFTLLSYLSDSFPMPLKLGIAIAFYVLMTVAFYTRFLPSLRTARDFEKPARLSIVASLAASNSKGTLFIYILFCIAGAVLLYWNTVQLGYQGITLYLTYVIEFLFLAFGVCNLLAIFRK